MYEKMYNYSIVEIPAIKNIYKDPGNIMIDFKFDNKLSRSEKREVVFKLLFSMNFENYSSYEEAFDDMAGEYPKIHDNEYIRTTFFGTVEYAEKADEMIASDSHNWSVDRLSTVTRTILRLAVYEIMSSDLSAKIFINEAVNLAKKYGDEKEPVFINGILNRIARENKKL